MTKRFMILLALMISTTFGIVKPVQAQVFMIDTVALEAACVSDADLCEKLIADALRQLKALGLDPAALNQQVGALAAKLITLTALVTDPILLSSVSASLVTVAAVSTDEAQELLIISIAATVAEGDAGDLVIDLTTLYASPS